MKLGIIDANGPLSSPSIFNRLEEDDIYGAKKIDLDVVLINIDDYKENKYCGLTTLYYIRLQKKLKCPIVCYGFFSLEQLVRSNPVFTILFAPGIAYLQIPFSKTELFKKIEKLKPICKELDIEKDYPKYVATAQSDEKLQHQDANLYALNKTTRTWYKFKEENHPNWFKNKFKNYGKDNIGYITSTFLNETTNNFEPKTKVFINNNLLNAINKTETFQNKQIIYIDDMASKGWWNLLKDIFQSQNVKNIKIGETEDETFTNLLTKNIDFKVSKDKVILLDLRLYNENSSMDVKELSGFKLFKKIKVYNPSIPIIIFSATSNKDTIQYLLHCGAYAVWNKEGVQNKLSNFDYRNKITSLIENVNKAFELTDNERVVNSYSFFMNFKHKEKFKIHSESDIDLYSIDELILDANSFISSNYTNTLNTYLLIEYFIEQKKKIILISDVYYEILKFANWDSVSESSKKITRKISHGPSAILNAKFAIDYLNELMTNKQIKVLGRSAKKGKVDEFGNEFEEGLFPYNKKYSDPHILHYCSIEKEKTKLILNSDKKLIQGINELKNSKNIILNTFWSLESIKKNILSLDWQ